MSLIGLLKFADALLATTGSKRRFLVFWSNQKLAMQADNTDKS